MIYNPENYWGKRLSNGFILKKVGHIGFSEYYNKWLYKAKIRAIKKALLSEHIEFHDITVCDIGCGTGFFIEFYKVQRAKEIVGVDITAVSVKNLKQKYPGYNFIKEDISSPLLVPKMNQKFDILNVFDVLYHIVDDKLFEQAIINICNLTNDNGFILITDLLGKKNINLAEHVKFRSKEAYKTALEKNNVKLLEIYPLYFFLNRSLFGKIRIMILRKIGMKMDNLFAPIYYYLDQIFLAPKRNNLNLILAKKVKK